jgi:hypothetical protein
VSHVPRRASSEPTATCPTQIERRFRRYGHAFWLYPTKDWVSD